MKKQIPSSWNCDPKHCEYLGTDADGNEYWHVGQDVMKHKDGASRWLCTFAAWPVCCQLVKVTA